MTHKHGARFKDLTGQKFGKLTVKSFAHMIGKMSGWNCVCDCGKEVLRRGPLMVYAAKNTPDCSLLHCGCGCRIDRHGMRGSAVEQFRYTTKVPLCEAWRKSLRLFLEECYNFRTKTNRYLHRRDNSRPADKNNFFWSSHFRRPRLDAAKATVIESLVSKGVDRASAEKRVNSVSKQRVRQLANIAMGLCPYCSDPAGNISKTHCDSCAVKQRGRRRRGTV